MVTGKGSYTSFMTDFIYDVYDDVKKEELGKKTKKKNLQLISQFSNLTQEVVKLFGGKDPNKNSTLNLLVRKINKKLEEAKKFMEKDDDGENIDDGDDSQEEFKDKNDDPESHHQEDDIFNLLKTTCNSMKSEMTS